MLWLLSLLCSSAAAGVKPHKTLKIPGKPGQGDLGCLGSIAIFPIEVVKASKPLIHGHLYRNRDV